MFNTSNLKGYKLLKLFIITLIISLTVIFLALLLFNRQDAVNIDVTDNTTEKQPAFILDFEMNHKNPIGELFTLHGSRAEEQGDIIVIEDPKSHYKTIESQIYKGFSAIAKYMRALNVISVTEPVSITRQDGLQIEATTLEYQLDKQVLSLTDARVANDEFTLKSDVFTYSHESGIVNLDNNVHIIIKEQDRR